MNDLDDDVMKTFYKKNTTTAELATKVNSLQKNCHCKQHFKTI